MRESAFFIIKPKKESRGQWCPCVTESLELRLGWKSVQGALGTCDRLRPRSRCLYFWLISPSTIRIFSSLFWILKTRKRDDQRASWGMGTDPSKCQLSRRTKASCGPSTISLSRFWCPSRHFLKLLALENFQKLAVSTAKAIGHRGYIYIRRGSKG